MKNTKKYCLKLVVGIFCLLFQKGFSQDKSLTFLGKAENENEIAELYKSVDQPLLVVNKNVYVIQSECISEKFAGNKASSNNKEIKTRNSGSSINANDSSSRNSGGSINSKNNQTRNSGGSIDQKSDQTRNSGGGVDNKLNQVRNSGGSVSTFSCEQNGERIILYLPGIKDSDVVRLYNNNVFIDKKYFKIINH